MGILRNILFILFGLFLCCFCDAQPTITEDFRKISSLLHDSSGIDLLNKRSFQYIQNEKKDSAEYFANSALTESRELNYLHGIAVSLCRKSQIAKHFDDDLVLTETLAKESLKWFEKTWNKDGIYDVYHELMFSIFGQSRFDEAMVYAQKKYGLAKEKGDDSKIFDAMANMGAIEKDAGNYEKSIYWSEQCREFALQKNNPYWLQGTLFGLGELFMKIEDYSSALVNFRQAFQMDNPQLEEFRRDGDFDIWMKMEYAEIFSHLQQFDSAWHYFELYKPVSKEDRYFRIYLVSTGEYFFLQKKYERALQNFLQGLHLHEKLSDRNEIQRSLIFVAETYLALQQYDSAIQYARKALNVAHTTKAKQIIRDACQVTYTAYDIKKQPDSANIYFRQYSVMDDTVANEKVKANLAVSNYKLRIELLDKDKQLQLQKLLQATQQKRFLIVVIIAVILIAAVIFRIFMLKRKNEKKQLQHDLQLQKLESEKNRSELQQQAAKLEMQALRAQMNPHFIFNSLNSINMFILENNKLQAAAHLSKFSKLVRLILQNSGEVFIPLERELETLNLYLELESLRFKDKFEYKILVDEKIDATELKVPPLIIQPYAENAIWHGLMHKKGKGHLRIELYQNEKILLCKVTDDGIGRKKAEELRSKSTLAHKSMGMRITKDRLAMLQKQSETFITITDLILSDGNSGGTEVLIEIPIGYD